MKIIYENTDITCYVQAKSCTVRDTAGERCDSLELELEDAATWLRWGPQEDERIRVTKQGYDSGEMYLHSIQPRDGVFRVLATSLPCAARRKAYRSFVGKTLEEILNACAVTSGMDYRIYGLDGKTQIPYIQREMESCAAFLCRLLRMEGAELKCVSGRYAAIGVLYAQERSAHQTVRLRENQPGVEMLKNGEKLCALTVRTPWASARAEDTAVPASHPESVENDTPARTALQAGRWARGLLLAHNRRCETLSLQSEFNPGWTAMTRIDVTGGSAADGEWLIADAEHDLIENSSTAKLHRCVASIR